MPHHYSLKPSVTYFFRKKKNQKCLFWKCKLLFFIYSQSRSWICFLHHVCMEIWCLFNCFRKRLWRLGNLQSPSKISLKSLFSIAKGKEERTRTRRAQFNKCLKVMSCPCCWICCWICCWHFNRKKNNNVLPLSLLLTPSSLHHQCWHQLHEWAGGAGSPACPGTNASRGKVVEQQGEGQWEEEHHLSVALWTCTTPSSLWKCCRAPVQQVAEIHA